jgi:hypothetical protein
MPKLGALYYPKESQRTGNLFRIRSSVATRVERVDEAIITNDGCGSPSQSKSRALPPAHRGVCRPVLLLVCFERLLHLFLNNCPNFVIR